MNSKKTIFVTYAVKEEFFPMEAEGCDILQIHTGVGKAKSAHILTKHICENKPDLVLNVGTAGTQKHNVGDIFVSTQFIDRDFETIRLPGIEHEINGLEFWSEDLPLTQWITNHEKLGVCNTGDSFVTQSTPINGDIIDMEAFAQALVCKEFNIPFLSVKYITDIIGQNSVELWESRLTEARLKLSSWFEQHDPLSVLS